MRNLFTITALLFSTVITACQTPGESYFGPEPIGFDAYEAHYLLGVDIPESPSDRAQSNSNKNSLNPLSKERQESPKYVYGDDLRMMLVRFEVENANREKTLLQTKRAVTGALISQSNAMCDAYLVDVFGYQNTRDNSLSIASDALTIAAGSPLKPEETTKGLALLGTWLGNSRDTINKSFYGDKNYKYIVTAILVKRTELLAGIQEALNSENLINVPFGSLVSAVQTYHSYCGLNKGITLVQEAADEKLSDDKKDADANLKKAQKGQMPGGAGSKSSPKSISITIDGDSIRISPATGTGIVSNVVTPKTGPVKSSAATHKTDGLDGGPIAPRKVTRCYTELPQRPLSPGEKYPLCSKRK